MQTLIDQEQIKSENKLCEHLSEFYLNNYFSHFNSNFYNFKKLNYQRENVGNLLNEIYDKFFIKNIEQDWIALNSIYKSFQNNNIREGCIFTLQFDDTGKYLATSNRTIISQK